MNFLILYNSASEQSVISKAIARIHAWQLLKNASVTGVQAGNSITTKDISTLTTGNMLTYIQGLTANTYDKIYVCVPTSSGGTNYTTLPYDDLALLNTLLKTAAQTAITTGTFQGNSTVTQFVLAASDTAIDDYYKGMFLQSAGTTVVSRYITGYTATSKIGTCATTTTALTTTSTYTIYSAVNLILIGDPVSNENACRVAWTTLYPLVVPNPVVSVMGGYGSGFKPHFLYALTADSFNATTVTKSGAFTNYLTQLNSGLYYLAVETATTGAGQIVKIASATANVITLANGGFVTLPTGSLVFQVTTGTNMILWDKYLPYAIKTYLALDTDPINQIWHDILDRYDMRKNATATSFMPDWATLQEYAQFGKAIFDAKSAGVVS